MNKDTLVKVMNRGTGPVGYTIPELNVRRQFEAGMTKEIPFGEIESLYMMRAGKTLMDKYLVIKNEEAIKALMSGVEPEYFYEVADVKRMLTTASYDEFLDCLDFAPDGVLDMIKDMAVTLPCYDMQKRQAIQDKTGLDITKAIEIRNTKYDEASETTSEEVAKPKRRVNKETTTTMTDSKRRTEAPKYTYEKPTE